MHLIAHDRRQRSNPVEGGPYRASMSLSGSAIRHAQCHLSQCARRPKSAVVTSPAKRSTGWLKVRRLREPMIRLRSNISASQVTSRASFLCMLVLRRQVFPVRCGYSPQPMSMAGSMSAADSFRWSPLAELQEDAVGSGTTRPWSTRSHAEMCETSPLTIIAYRGCRHTDPPDSSNVTPAQHQMRALGLKLPRSPQCRQPLRQGMKGRRVRAATFSRASGA